MKKAAYFLAIGMFLLLAGCGGKEVIKPSAEATAAEQTLGALTSMREAYERRDLQGVLAGVSQDYAGGYSVLQMTLRRDMEEFSRVELDMTVERVEISKDGVSVAFHWFGNWYDAAGRSREGRGNSIFTFKETPEGMRLINVTGDSPFGALKG